MLQPIECKSCHKIFIKKRSNQEYCSPLCGRKFWRLNHPEYLKQYKKQHARRPTNKYTEKILIRDGYKCQVCGSPNKLHIHHITPRTQGGLSSEDNLVTLCSFCHATLEVTHKKEKSIENCIMRAIMELRSEISPL